MAPTPQLSFCSAIQSPIHWRSTQGTPTVCLEVECRNERAQRLNTEVHTALGLDKKTNTVQQEGCDNRDKIKAERCPVEPQRRNCY